MPPHRIRIPTVDDHPIVREGIAVVIDAESDMAGVGEAKTGAEALEQHRLLRSDVTLMDLQLPGMNGIAAIQAIRETSPYARFIVLTTFQGDVQALRALRAGAAGYMLKSMLRKELLQAIRIDHAGGKRIPPVIAAELAAHVTDDAFSEREIEVLQKVAAGISNKWIATMLQVSEATVKSHIKNIMMKLATNDRAHAVTMPRDAGFWTAKSFR